MGYIKDMYGARGGDFVYGFMAAMETYAVWRAGKRYIGSPEKELKSAQKEAVRELMESERAEPFIKNILEAKEAAP